MNPVALSLGSLLLLAAAATAHPVLPTLFAGNGVANGDVIDIRAEPDDAAPIIGHIPSDSRDVEVVAFDETEKWGRVNQAEASGWLLLERLREQGKVWPATGLPHRTLCYGTEPFWSLQTDGDSAEFSVPEQVAATLPITGVLATGASDDPRRVVVAEDATLGLTLSMAPGRCSDGMSDRAFGLTARVIREAGPLPDLLLGCCTISP